MQNKWTTCFKIWIEYYYDDGEGEEQDSIEYESNNKEIIKYFNNKKYQIDIIQEISVIQNANKHGFESWGWGNFDKIILFEDVQMHSIKDIEKAINMAKIIAQVFNEKNC